MIKYEVGKKFPHDKYLGRGEITVAIVNEAFVDVLVCLSGITSEEKKTFRKGMLTVGFFEYKETPFVVFDLGSGFNFDVSIDITRLSVEQQNCWLNQDANVINMYLVNSETGNLEAMRMIGVNFQDEIRDTLERQTALTNVQAQINEAIQLIDTKTMLNNLTKKITFK